MRDSCCTAFMSKQQRHDCPSTMQHIIGRAVNGEFLFPSERYSQIFWNELGTKSIEFGVDILALFLLGNHYHALLRGERAAISDTFHRALSRLANTLNKDHERRGALVGRRFKSIPIVDDNHHFNVIQYVPMNPVHHKLARDPAQWHWSTHAILIGMRPAPDWFDRNRALRAFGFADPESYNRFVLSGTHLELPPLTMADFKRRNIRRLAMQGSTTQEIAALSGLSQRQIQRLLKGSVAEGSA